VEPHRYRSYLALLITERQKSCYCTQPSFFSSHFYKLTFFSILEQDRLDELRHTSEQEKSALTSRLAEEEETKRHCKDRIAVLEERCRASCLGLGGDLTIDDRVQGLLGERALLERLLSEAHEHLSEVSAYTSAQRSWVK